MFKKLNWTTVVLNTTAAVVMLPAIAWASQAKAEPPAAMTYMEQTPPLIGCDTRAQIDEVIASIKEGSVKKKLEELSKVIDDKGEPVCMYGHAISVVFGESEHIGKLQDHERTVDTWVVHVGNHTTAFYVLWGDVVNATGI